MRPLDDNGLLGEGLKGVEGSKLTLRERVVALEGYQYIILGERERKVVNSRCVNMLSHSRDTSTLF